MGSGQIKKQEYNCGVSLTCGQQRADTSAEDSTSYNNDKGPDIQPVVDGAMCWSHKSFKASVAVPPAPARVPSQRSLAPSVSTVANDKDNNEMIPRAVHRCPGICLTVEENSGKPQLGDRLMKGLCDRSSPQCGPFLPPNEVGRITQHVRKREGRREGRNERRKEVEKEREKGKDGTGTHRSMYARHPVHL